MANLLDFEVTFVDGREQTITPLPVDIVAFEREHKCGIGSVADDPRMEQMLWLAWTCCRRRQETTDGFDAWMNTVANIEPKDDGEEGEGSAPLPKPSDS